MNYSELERAYIEFKKLEIEYYKKRYSYWNLIYQFKKNAKQTLPYKKYEGQARRLTRKLRRTLLNSKPRGSFELDHKQSILECYCTGKTLDECCDLKNLEWKPKKLNQLKSILSPATWATNPFNK
jgi:hypothetical protein